MRNRHLRTRAVSSAAALFLVFGIGNVAFADSLPSETEASTSQTALAESSDTLEEDASLSETDAESSSSEDSASSSSEDSASSTEAESTGGSAGTSTDSSASSSAASSGSAQTLTTKQADSASETEAIIANVGESDAAEIMPLAAGPETATGNYMYWTVTDASGNLVGGATTQIMGPRNNDSSWGTSRDVVDCVSSPCTGYDRDPDPGEFQVVSNTGGFPAISNTGANSRWRVQQGGTDATNAPTGYYWTNTQTWVTITGTGQGATSGQWTSSGSIYRHSFGTFRVAPNPEYSIVVRKGDLRTSQSGGTNFGVDSKYVEGARFGLYTSATAQTPTATCTITPGATTCQFSNVAAGTWWVGELDPVAGSTADLHYSDPIEYLTTGSGTTFTDRAYRYSVTVGGATATYNVPSDPTTTNDWDESSGRFANVIENPKLNLTCEAGVKVALVMDLSGSVNSYQNNLAQAATALVDGLTGTPSSVALFSFSTSSPATEWNNGNTSNVLLANHASPQSVLTSAGANTVKGWYSTAGSNGLTANFTPSGGTNWDAGMWAAAQGNVDYDYDIVFVLTDGNPTFSASTPNGSGSLTTFRELERAVFSANLLKDAGTRVVTIGIGSGLSNYNLSAVSGSQGYQAGLSLNDVDYTTANWSELADLLADFAQGISCQAGVTVQKLAAEGTAAAFPTNGWSFTTTATSGTVSSPATQATSGTTATASWTVQFSQVSQEASVTISEAQLPDSDWSLEGIACTVNGESATITQEGTQATIAGVGVGDQVRCVFTNRKAQVGELAIEKAFDSTVPTGSGTETADTVFSGTYSCELNEVNVSTGIWSRTGVGAAAITTQSGTAYDQLPVGAVCSVEETKIDGESLTQNSEGLPNSTWIWGTPTYNPDDEVTIVANTTSTVTVTNTTTRVYGNFSVTKVVPEGSMVDSTMTFGGSWSCTLGTETVNGTWGQIAAGATWTSTASDKIPLGATCTATETNRATSPVSDGSYEWDGDPVVTPADGVTAGSDASTALITVTNATKAVLGSATWQKVDEDGALLGGSVWTLTGPEPYVGGVEIEDCDATSADNCTGHDKDPDVGAFRIENLLWGTYTLVETSAPSGYILDTTPHEFVIGADGTAIVVGQFENVPVIPPTIPLTGGVGRDAFFIGGFALVLIASGGIAAMHIRNRRKEVR